MLMNTSGFEVSAETISNITRRVLTDVKEWQSRALKPIYAVVFMDRMVFKGKKDGVVQKNVQPTRVSAWIQTVKKRC